MLLHVCQPSFMLIIKGEKASGLSESFPSKGILPMLGKIGLDIGIIKFLGFYKLG